MDDTARVLAEYEVELAHEDELNELLDRLRGRTHPHPVNADTDAYLRWLLTRRDHDH